MARRLAAASRFVIHSVSQLEAPEMRIALLYRGTSFGQVIFVVNVFVDYLG